MTCGCYKFDKPSASSGASSIEEDYWNRRKRQTMGSFPYRGVIRLSEAELTCKGAYILKKRGCKALRFPEHFDRNKIPVVSGTFSDTTDIAGLIYFKTSDGTCCKVFKDITRGPGEPTACECYNI